MSGCSKYGVKDHRDEGGVETIDWREVGKEGKPDAWWMGGRVWMERVEGRAEDKG